MYDYIGIHSEKYITKIKTKELEQYLCFNLCFSKDSNLKYFKEINGQLVRATGIPADTNGGYAFNSLDGIEEINLIKLDIPKYLDNTLERAILDIANAIANEFSWTIDDERR